MDTEQDGRRVLPDIPTKPSLGNAYVAEKGSINDLQRGSDVLERARKGYALVVHIVPNVDPCLVRHALRCPTLHILVRSPDGATFVSRPIGVTDDCRARERYFIPPQEKDFTTDDYEVGVVAAETQADVTKLFFAYKEIASIVVLDEPAFTSLVDRAYSVLERRRACAAANEHSAALREMEKERNRQTARLRTFAGEVMRRAKDPTLAALARSVLFAKNTTVPEELTKPDRAQDSVSVRSSLRLASLRISRERVAAQEKALPRLTDAERDQLSARLRQSAPKP